MKVPVVVGFYNKIYIFIVFTFNYNKIVAFSVVNECEQKEHPLCEQHCIDLIIGYKCSCEDGFQVNRADNKSCLDIDECSGRLIIY